MRLRPGHARRSPTGSPRGGGLAAARSAAGSPGDPGLARTADAPPLAGEASPPGGADSLRQEPGPAGPGWGVVRRGLGAGGRSADPAAGRMCRAGPGFRRARRDPGAGAPAGRALSGEGDLARLRAGNLHGTAGARPPARRAARPGRPAGGAYQQPECRRRGDRLGSRRRAAPHLGPAAGRRIPAADRVGGGDRPTRGPIPERDRGVVGRRLRAGRGRPGRARRRHAAESGAGRISCPRP